MGSEFKVLKCFPEFIHYKNHDFLISVTETTPWSTEERSQAPWSKKKIKIHKRKNKLLKFSLVRDEIIYFLKKRFLQLN